jgi:hypothetical protein
MNARTQPFGLSLPFDRLRTIGARPFGLSLSKPLASPSFDRLRMIGDGRSGRTANWAKP